MPLLLILLIYRCSEFATGIYASGSFIKRFSCHFISHLSQASGRYGMAIFICSLLGVCELNLAWLSGYFIRDHVFVFAIIIFLVVVHTYPLYIKKRHFRFESLSPPFAEHFEHLGILTHSAWKVLTEEHRLSFSFCER